MNVLLNWYEEKTEAHRANTSYDFRGKNSNTL